jgi:hypothetical protein
MAHCLDKLLLLLLLLLLLFLLFFVHHAFAVSVASIVSALLLLPS